MIETVPPVLSKNDSLPSADKQSPLLDSIDNLLERYLCLLDQYQAISHSLQSQLASGYLQLAQANFTSPNRIRYGQDFYDDRMQASFLISVDVSTQRFSTTKSQLQEASNPGAPPEERPNSSLKDSGDLGPKPFGPQTPKSRCDPLNWFGILVPPALRSAQGHFKIAMTELPSLVNVIREMVSTEEEIEKLRRTPKDTR
ncbi:hypothetical protein MMC20_001466 [Loxospora ochrophaea]|nr:hypothetical protein [Loxospora ochrophaea]